MRLPLTTDLTTRDGSVSQDAKLVNAFNGEEVTKRAGVSDLGLIDLGVAQFAGCFTQTLCVIDDALSSVSIAGLTATPTLIGGLSPIAADLPITGQVNGAAQNEQLLIKSSDQAWVYTP